jgi:hypothetical protein
MPSELDQSGQPGSNRHDQLWKIGAVVLPLSWESAGPGQRGSRVLVSYRR